MGHIKTCNFGAKNAVLNAQIHRRGLGPLQTCSSGYKDAVLNAQATDECWES